MSRVRLTSEQFNTVVTATVAALEQTATELRAHGIPFSVNQIEIVAQSVGAAILAQLMGRTAVPNIKPH